MWLCKRPRILSFPKFLSGEECSRIIQLARAKGMEPDAPVTDSDQSIRTSNYCWMASHKSEQDYACLTKQDERLLQSIAERISVVSCLPEEHGETFQILQYRTGEYYKEHPDFFTKAQTAELALGGQRLATMLVYLQDVPKGGGGETYFPRAAGGGLTIRPEKGLGILFFNTKPDGRVEPRSVHASLPLTSGDKEKWTLTRWIRQRPYLRPQV